MITFFRNSSMQADYGEQECCTEPSLLLVAEYQEYLFNDCIARGQRGESKYTLDYTEDVKARHEACMAQITHQ